MVLNYNLGTWPSLTQSERRLWCGGVLRLYRRLLVRHFTKEDQFHMTEDRVLTVLQLPHPDELLHAARLSQFAMCLHRDNMQFWALAAQDEDWIAQVHPAMHWTYGHMDRSRHIPYCPFLGRRMPPASGRTT